MKLEEDLMGFPTYPVDRTARVVAGEPLRVTELLASGALPAKNGAEVLTEMLERRLSGCCEAKMRINEGRKRSLRRSDTAACSLRRRRISRPRHGVLEG